MGKRSRIVIWVITTLLFTAAVCYGFSLFSNFFPSDSFIFAFELQFLLMAWFAFSVPHLKLKYNWEYFNPQQFEKNGAIYRYLSVNAFRKILVVIGWEKVTNSMNKIVKNNYENLKSREQNTRSSEFSHLSIAILIMMLIPFLVSSIEEAKWLILTNIIFHIYPIFIQRYNRPRYLRIIKKFEKRKNLSGINDDQDLRS